MAASTAAVCALITPAAIAQQGATTAPQTSIPIEKRVSYLAKPAVVYVSCEYTGSLRTKDGGSVFMVYGGSDGKKLLTTLPIPPITIGGAGSGFIVDKSGYVVTSAHVVEWSDDDIKSRFIDNTLQWASEALPPIYRQAGERPFPENKADFAALRDILNKNYAAEANRSVNVILARDVGAGKMPKPYPAEIRRLSGSKKWVSPDGAAHLSGKDVAILKIEADELPTVRMGNSDRSDVGDKVLLVGYPGVAQSWSHNASSSLEASMTSGIISARKQHVDGSPVLQIDAASYHGNSGGPAFNEAGEVVGILTYGPSQATAQGDMSDVESTGFLVPINVAKSFANEINVNNSPSATDRRYEEGMMAYWSKDYTKAAQAFDSILRIDPGDAFAMQYRAMAERAKLDQQN